MSLFLCDRQEIVQSMSSKRVLRYLTMPMAAFGDCENAGLSALEGALWQRLIVRMADSRDYCHITLGWPMAFPARATMLTAKDSP
ncbi:hypothetical protein [Cupriavidus basilensis]|uniref:hypothetical protein n=1 Tax=Cupriavidus basilensis TaxID=68895 RepID=UPI0005BB771C|nr:hypothetical protein [Cupriavidus basilensis]